MVDALKFLNHAPRGSGERVTTEVCVLALSCWNTTPLLWANSGQSLASNSSVVDSRYLNAMRKHFLTCELAPRSCDLTPLDYFLWGYVKSLIYADKPQTLDHLEDNIRRVIADIRPQMLEKVIENWTSRLDYIRASRGTPMPEIIFKM
ncbi:hypothetical protein TNCV_4685901 [Trichonephila clavipes]|nr:hypothetical protein TNCV_4685901 [Trichonephila clavipes]